VTGSYTPLLHLSEFVILFSQKTFSLDQDFIRDNLLRGIGRVGNMGSCYCAKVFKIEQEDSDYIFPKLLIYLVIHPDHEIGDDVILTSIIHATPAAESYYDNFRSTYLGGCEEEAGKAVGRWGMIQYRVVRFATFHLTCRELHYICF